MVGLRLYRCILYKDKEQAPKEEYILLKPNLKGEILFENMDDQEVLCTNFNTITYWSIPCFYPLKVNLFDEPENKIKMLEILESQAIKEN